MDFRLSTFTNGRRRNPNSNILVTFFMFVKKRLFTFGRVGGVVLPRACQSAPESLNLLKLFWEFLTCPCFSHRELTTLSTAVLSYTYMLIYLYLYM